LSCSTSRKAGRGDACVHVYDAAVKRIVLAVSILALALVAVVWRSTSKPDVAPAGVETAQATAAPTGGALATAATREERSSSGSASAPPNEPAARELVIEVVDAKSQAPVVGARVFVEREDVDPIARLAAEERVGFSGPSLAPLIGREFTSDALGRVRLPSPPRASTIWAGLEHRHGELEIEAGATSARIELVARRCVTVEVTDRAGRPVSDVAVGLLATELGEWNVVEQAPTDVGGRVEIHSVDTFAANEAALLRLATPMVACTPEFAEFTAATLPDGVVRLVIEDTGTVELVASDALGTPIEMAVRLDLRVDDHSRVTLPFGIGAHERRFVWASDGVARFERVGVGLALRADGFADGFRFTERFFPGPRALDELVRITVPVDEVLPALRARLLDAEGNVLANRPYELSVEDPDVRDLTLYSEQGRTDEHGRLCEYASSAELNDAPHEVRVDLAEPGTVAIRGRAAWSARTERRGVLSRIEYDLGDIVCRSEPFFCAGRVIDADGVVVDDAEVLHGWEDADGRFLGGPTAHTNSRGEFEIGVPAKVERIHVAAGRERWSLCDQRTVTRGTRDVLLQLPAERVFGTLEGSWLVWDGLTMDESELTFESDFDGERHFRSWGSSAAHRFTTMLQPGVHTLIFSFDEEEVARIEGVEIEANETHELAPIDLRARIHALTFRVVDENGAPLSDGTVNVLRGGEFLRDAPLGADGRATLPSLATTVDVIASAAGRRSRLFTGVESGATFELPRGIRAELRAPALGDVDLALVVELAYCGADPESAYSDTIALAFEGERASAEVPIAGEYCVWKAAVVRRSSGARFELESADVTLMTIVEAPAESVLSLPADALAKALQAATGR
jgi:hypothetical protein